MAILFTASLWADRGLRQGIHALPVSESSAATCLSVSSRCGPTHRSSWQRTNPSGVPRILPSRISHTEVQ